MKRSVRCRKIWLKSLFFGAFIATTSCNVNLGDAAGTEEAEKATEEAKKAASEGTFAVAGSLNLSGSGLNLTEETILKATYAKLDEDKVTLGADGSISDLNVKPAPFSLTVFQNDAPVCNIMFQVGTSKVGSFEPAADLDLGNLTCHDGTAEVPEERTSGSAATAFTQAVLAGDVDSSVLETLTDAEGLSVRMLAFHDERRSMDDMGPGPMDGGGDCGPNCGPGPGPGPGGPGDFKMATPQQCVGAGYAVGDWAFNSYERDFGSEEDMKDQMQGPTLFFDKVDEEGNYTMTVVEESEDGGEQADIFNVTLGGFGKEFAMVGESTIPENDIKSQGAERIIREILNSLDTGSQPPPYPNFRPDCDPLNFVNRIIGQLGHGSYDTQSVFGFSGGFMGGPGGMQKAPLCSAISSGDNSLKTIDEFCYEDPDNDGEKTLKTFTDNLAATSICQAADNGAPVRYWNNFVKTADGEKLRGCMRQMSDPWGQSWTETYLSGVSEEDCYAKDEQARDQAQRATILEELGKTADWNIWFGYREINREMRKDCSELRNSGVALKACVLDGDRELEPDFQEAWDTWQVDDSWHMGKVSLNTADVYLDEQKAKMSNNGFSEMDNVRDQIDMCVKDYEHTIQELDNRKANINSITQALGILASTKNADGTLKYIKEEVSKYQKHGVFEMTPAALAKLRGVLKKAEEAIDGWQGSISKVKETYAVVKKASLKVDESESKKCLPDEIGTQEDFEKLYRKFALALKGAKDTDTDLTAEEKAANKGLQSWMNKSFNHANCMNWDDNIRKIREFGISAPTQGIKGSIKSEEEETNEAFLTEGECSDGGYSNGMGGCVETVKCSYPAGATTYVTFDSIISNSTIEEGCANIKEKIAMMGRETGREEQVKDPFGNTQTVPEGVIRAKVLLMTIVEKKNCSITVNIPKLDGNGCFVFENDAGKSFADLTTEELNDTSLDQTTFKLKTDGKKVPLQDMSNREIIEMFLIPNSSITSGREAAEGEASSGGSSDLDSLISG